MLLFEPFRIDNVQVMTTEGWADIARSTMKHDWRCAASSAAALFFLVSPPRTAGNLNMGLNALAFNPKSKFKHTPRVGWHIPADAVDFAPPDRVSLFKF